MRPSRIVSSVSEKHIATLETGCGWEAWLAPVGLASLLLLAVVSIWRSPAVPGATPEPRVAAGATGTCEGIRNVAIDPHGQTVTLRLVRGRFIECSLRLPRLPQRIDLSPALAADVLGTALSLDGTTLVAGDRDGCVVVRRKSRTSAIAVHDAPVTALACSPQGRRVASAARGSLVLWAADSGKVIWRRDNPNWNVARLAFSGDGRRLLAVQGNELVQVWDVMAPAIVQTFHAIPRAHLALLSPDGRTLVTVGHGDDLEFHDVESGRVSSALDRPAGAADVVAAVAFSPDGRLLACGFYSGTIELWDIAAASGAGELIGHDGLVAALWFSAGGDRLYSAASDATVRVWNVERKQETDRIDVRSALNATPR